MKNKLLTGLGLLMMWCAGCTYRNEQDLYPQGGAKCQSDTVTVVSFSQHIQPIFRQNCALSGCHNSISHEGGLNLDSAFAYQNLFATGSGYIDTTDPTSSLLYSQMRSVSLPMPPTGLLDSCTTKMVLKWITQKALNN